MFTSQLDGTTVFQFRPYGATNALVVGYNFPSSATLTLTAPRAYKSLEILACSANASGGTGTFVLNFTNGSHSQAFAFNAQDWFSTTTNIAMQAMGRLKLVAFGAEDNGASNPNLFQTTLNLAALGLNLPIASITFTKPASSGTQQDCAVFAVSGSVMPDAPNIVQQPLSVTNNLPAQGAAFNLVASGVPPLGYQWYYSSNGIPGTYASLPVQTNASLVFNPVLQIASSGSYVAVVSNSFGAATSAVANLSVYRAPVITQQPAPTNTWLLAGLTNTWSVAANAALPVNYYWCQNTNRLPLATNSSFRLANLQVSDSGSYSVVVSNAFGAVTSSVISLAVIPANYPLSQAVLADRALGYWRLDETAGAVAHDYVAGMNGAYTPKVLLGQPGNRLLDTHPAARFGSLAASNSCVTNIAVDFGTPGSATFPWKPGSMAARRRPTPGWSPRAMAEAASSSTWIAAGAATRFAFSSAMPAAARTWPPAAWFPTASGIIWSGCATKSTASFACMWMAPTPPREPSLPAPAF